MFSNVKIFSMLCKLSGCSVPRGLIYGASNSTSKTMALPTRNTSSNFKELNLVGTKIPHHFKASKPNNPKSKSLFQYSSNLTQCKTVLPMHDVPNSILQQVFELPSFNIIDSLDEIPEQVIRAPPAGNVTEKVAARLIVIRRHKMRKHKLRKLRKRMKFEWAKVRQRRELRKEKTFQADLIKKITIAERFDAKRYVARKLAKAHAAVDIGKTQGTF